MEIELLSLQGLRLVKPTVHVDERGFFIETYKQSSYAAHGVDRVFMQDNHSRSNQHVIRGLKFQYDLPTDKLVRVSSGRVFAVAVDIRPDSPTFGKYESVELSSENHFQLYLPFGFAFGFCALSEEADVLYKLSAEHSDQGSGTILWNDTDIGITWPTATGIVTEKDAAAPTLKEWKESPEAQHFLGLCGS